MWWAHDESLCLYLSCTEVFGGGGVGSGGCGGFMMKVKPYTPVIQRYAQE